MGDPPRDGAALPAGDGREEAVAPPAAAPDGTADPLRASLIALLNRYAEADRRMAWRVSEINSAEITMRQMRRFMGLDLGVEPGAGVLL